MDNGGHVHQSMIDFIEDIENDDEEEEEEAEEDHRNRAKDLADKTLETGTKDNNGGKIKALKTWLIANGHEEEVNNSGEIKMLLDIEIYKAYVGYLAKPGRRQSDCIFNNGTSHICLQMVY